jgi:hypothetical protein
MAHTGESKGLPEERIAIERRADGTVVVRVRSETGAAGPMGCEAARLPDAVFSFRCGDPQYSYWLGRFNDRARGG